MLQTNRRRKQSGANTPSPSFCLTERQWFDCGLSTPLLVPLCTELYTVSIAVHTVCGKESSYCHSFVEISGCWSVSGFKIHGFYGCKFNKLCCSMLNSDWGNANCIVEVFFMSGKRGVMNAIFYKLLKKKSCVPWLCITVICICETVSEDCCFCWVPFLGHSFKCTNIGILNLLNVPVMPQTNMPPSSRNTRMYHLPLWFILPASLRRAWPVFYWCEFWCS